MALLRWVSLQKLVCKPLLAELLGFARLRPLANASLQERLI